MPVYDDQKLDQPTSDDDLRNITGISKAEEEAIDSRAPQAPAEGSALSSEQLANAEEDAATPSNSRAENAEQESLGLDDTVGSGFREEGRSRRSLRSRLPNRKNAIVGGIIGLLLGGTVGSVTLLHGPMQVLKLSSVLGKLSHATDSGVSIRNGNLLAYARASATGDIGEARVGRLGSKRYHKLTQQLADAGIEFDRQGTLTGKPRGITIDAGKNPQFNKTSLAQSRSAIAEFYKIPESQVHQISGLDGGRFRIQMGDLNINKSRLLAFTSLNHLEDGTVLTAMNKRVMAKFFNLPSLFSPLDRVQAERQNRFGVKLERRARERERLKQKEPKLSSKYVAAKARINEKLAPHRVKANSVLFITGAACLIREVAEDVPKANFAAVVAPAIVQSQDKQSVGAQIKSGHNFTLGQIGDVVSSFKDDQGRTIWEAKPLNALSTNGPGQGEDISDEHKQAFTSEANTNNILNFLADNGATSVACSTPGLILQGLAGGALLALGPGGWTAKATQVGVSAVATTAVIKLIKDTALDHLTVDPVKAIAGPQGGALLAYGARAGANLNSITMGGVAMSSGDEQLLMREFENKELEKFRQKNLFARLFDINDHRSALATAILSPSALHSPQGLSSIANSFLNPFKSLSKPLALLGSKTYANEAQYDWGFPLYAPPQKLLTDPKYEDPYENAGIAVSLFKSSVGSSYIKKARTCFGVDIVYGNNGWDAIKQEEVNPAELEYINTKCDDLSDEQWARTLLFVFDTTIEKLKECYEGDDESLCQEVGLN